MDFIFALIKDPLHLKMSDLEFPVRVLVKFVWSRGLISRIKAGNRVTGLGNFDFVQFFLIKRYPKFLGYIFPR
jgi:hypothetical protein